jgi:serine protease Do
VNFAIKGAVVLDALQTAHRDVYQTMLFDKSLSFDEIQKSVVKVRSGIIPEDLEKRPKLVARLEYKSRWDVWYRFSYFVVVLYDFDSHQRLVAAGQGRDNLVSNEDVVIRDTFTEIRKTLGKS